MKNDKEVVGILRGFDDYFSKISNLSYFFFQKLYVNRHGVG